ncbi:MAG: hypothetical protein JNL58_16630 [Planctomyces sp.]|nr:hypothetical protein [Planctomyces sp.]
MRIVILSVALLTSLTSSAQACCLFPLLDPSFWFGGCCLNNPAAGRQIIDDWLGYGYLRGQQGTLGHYPLRPWSCYTPMYTRLQAPPYIPPFVPRQMVAPMPMMAQPMMPFSDGCGCDPCMGSDPCGTSDPCSTCDPCGGASVPMQYSGMPGYQTPGFPTAFPSAWPTPQWRQTQYVPSGGMQTADCGCNGGGSAMGSMTPTASTWNMQPQQYGWNPQPQMAWQPQQQVAWQPRPQMAWQPQPQVAWQPQPQMAWQARPQMMVQYPQAQTAWASQPYAGWQPVPQTAMTGDIWGDHEYSGIPGAVPVQGAYLPPAALPQSAAVPIQPMSFQSRQVPVHRTALGVMNRQAGSGRYSAAVR